MFIIMHYCAALMKLFCEDFKRSSPEIRKCSNESVQILCSLAAEEEDQGCPAAVNLQPLFQSRRRKNNEVLHCFAWKRQEGS